MPTVKEHEGDAKADATQGPHMMSGAGSQSHGDLRTHHPHSKSESNIAG
jgi:hypothetical protein